MRACVTESRRRDRRKGGGAAVAAPAAAAAVNNMEQFEQLLTCAICLDRYRNPKLLPCQHSFCMEPCLEGLVDYVRRQIKCPECRAEHRIPYQGVQGYPTNVTLQRFLELHIEITGELPDPTSGQVMERCNVCSEKAYCSLCSHCDKKVCEECKGAHMDILRREISRINNQIRRGIHRLQDALSLVEKNSQNIQTNCLSVSEEVDEIYRRLSKAVKDRSDYLRTEIDRYLSTELRTLTTLKDNLELEIANILSNCDLVDKYMHEGTTDVWDDCELMDAKEIFLKTVDFIRNFEYENADYSRKVRLILAHDPNQLVLHVANFGDLNTAHPPNTASLQLPGPGLMRSKSDHRLASQFRQQQDDASGVANGDDSAPVLSGRKFGERPKASERIRQEYDNDYGDESRPTSTARSRYSSRFRRHTDIHNQDSDTEQRVRFTAVNTEPVRERVLDTEDVARGPLSGVTRLKDSPRVMKKLQDCDSGVTKKAKEVKEMAAATAAAAAAAPTAGTPAANVQPAQLTTRRNAPTTATRQISEDDEISKIKKQNKGATTSQVHTPAPVAENPDTTRTNEANVSSDGSDVESVRKPVLSSRRTTDKSKPTPPPPVVRQPSSETESSTESSQSSNVPPRQNNASDTVKLTTQHKYGTTRNDASDATSYQNRYAHGNKSPSSKDQGKQPEVDEESESESSSEEETESESESEEEEEEEEEERQPQARNNKKTESSTKEMSKSDIGPLLARSAHARNSRDDSSASTYTPRYTKYQQRKEHSPPPPTSTPAPSTTSSTNRYQRKSSALNDNDDNGRYNSSTGGYTSRFLNKSKSSAILAPDEEDHTRYEDADAKYPTSRSRYMALKERRQRLARSRSSQHFGADENDDNDEPVSPTSTTNPNAYLAAKGYTKSSTGHDLSRSRSSHALKSRDNSPERPGAMSSSSSITANGNSNEKEGAALSSWARYLKNKYGNRTTNSGKDGKDVIGGSSSANALASSTSTSSTTPSSSSSSASRRLSLGLPLRAVELQSSDDDQKNMQGSPTTPTAVTAEAGIGVVAAGTSPKSQYLQKCHQLFELGSRGSEAGCFTWPRGVAVGPDNRIVVADSSNHRVQVFDASGKFLKEFGQYGSADGEFDCLAGVAVNRIGQYIIADRYNHRIQVFDPSGRFLRAFGSQGTADGRFNYPWGITTDALGFIYVCDKENHRVQVFQSDGSFVGKFGSMGSKEGQLEHPHYIAVSSTNRVVVSDSNNHRIQVFDVNGKMISSFGTEGSDEGQFKFPRGVAVDDQGYICVADSGNNRIQIFQPDGSFLRAFGSWGSAKGEFKGLEGVAMTPNGHILVCDRENHRIQVF